MQNKTKTVGKTTTESVGVTETQRSIGEFSDAWNSHIETLQRLKWYLSEESRAKLDQLNNELRVLLYEATNDLKRRREVKQNVA